MSGTKQSLRITQTGTIYESRNDWLSRASNTGNNVTNGKVVLDAMLERGEAEFVEQDDTNRYLYRKVRTVTERNTALEQRVKELETLMIKLLNK